MRDPSRALCVGERGEGRGVDGQRGADGEGAHKKATSPADTTPPLTVPCERAQARPQSRGFTCGPEAGTQREASTRAMRAMTSDCWIVETKGTAKNAA